MNRYAQMISELKTPEVMKRLTYLYGQRGGMLVAQSARYSRLLKRHEELVGYEGPIAMVSAPGRTEIGGNHTDHNRGKVLAAAVNLDTLAAVSPRADGVVNIHSEGYAPLTLSLDDLSVHEAEKGTTAALVRGVADGLQKAGLRVGGFDAVITSTVRSGSGLSSSAAVEVLLCAIFDEIYNEGKLDFKRRAQISQYAENVYFGKPSGLMDQTASSVGSAIMIDFQNPDAPIVDEIRFDLDKHGYHLCITDTKGSHADLTDDYTAIRREMESVAAFFGKKVLREVDENSFWTQIASLRQKVGDRAVLRAAHFFAECRRAGELRTAAAEDRFEDFLKLILMGGHSSFEYNQNAYSIRHPQQQGVSVGLVLSQHVLEGRGAWRLQGGGFAGTIQAFVPDDLLDVYRKTMENAFGQGACYVLNVRNYGAIEVTQTL